MKYFIELDENNIVTTIHHDPFNKDSGMSLTEEELLEKGILIEEKDYPEMPQCKPDEYIEETYNSLTNTFEREIKKQAKYEDPEIEALKKQNEFLGKSITEIKLQLMQGGK